MPAECIYSRVEKRLLAGLISRSTQVRVLPLQYQRFRFSAIRKAGNNPAAVRGLNPPRLFLRCCRVFLWRIAQQAERQIVGLQDSGSEPDSPPSRRKQGTLSDDVCVTSQTALLHFLERYPRGLWWRFARPLR